MLIVQHNGIQQFAADAVNVAGNVYNFSDNAPPPPPVGRLTRTNVNFPPASNSASRDMTQFDDIWGHATYNDAERPWPGANVSNARWLMQRGMYVSAGFIIPANTPITRQGYFKGVSNFGGPVLLFSVSPNVGDFSQAFVMEQDDGSIWRWRLQNGTAFYHLLPRSTQLYVNIKFQDPDMSGAVHVLHSWS